MPMPRRGTLYAAVGSFCLNRESGCTSAVIQKGVGFSGLFWDGFDFGL